MNFYNINFTALTLSDDTASNIFTKSFYPLSQINHPLQSITQYFSNLSPPSMPQFNLEFGWLWTPFLTLGIALRGFLFNTTRSQDQLKVALDEDKFQILLSHIDNYIDNTIGQRLNDNNKVVMDQVNDRLLLIIANNIKESLVKYQYQLTAKDLESINVKIREQLNDNLNEREKSILAKISLSSDETAKKINNLASANVEHNKDMRMENRKTDLDEIILMILSSDKLFTLIDGRLKPIIYRLDTHDTDISDLKLDLNKLKHEIAERFKIISEDMSVVRSQQSVLVDDLYKFKTENDEALHSFMLKINERLSTLSGYSSIDQSIRKNVLAILGFNIDDSNAATYDENSVKNWISSTFIAKGQLEELLNNLELKSDKAFQLQLDKNAGVLMEEINKEIKNQIAIAIVEKDKELKGMENYNLSASILSESDVLRIVKEVLAIYDADRTGLVDFALESAGGEVISTRLVSN